MFKACSRCGKIHPYNVKCTAGIDWNKYKSDTDKLHNTTAWHNKAFEIKQRSMFLCAVCMDEWKQNHEASKLSSDNLEVHHITKLRDDPELLLDDLNLICLCRTHHRKADNNQLDPDYLRRLARLRDAQ